jgi:aspartate aminotransferase
MNVKSTSTHKILSRRMETAAASPMLLLVAKTAELREAGMDIIGLSAGEPDFDTPAHISHAGIEAIKSGMTRYTPTGGTSVLKKSIIAKFKRDNDLEYSPSEIIVTTGAKQVLFSALAATLDAGDEVVIPTPTYPSYEQVVRIFGGTPVLAQCRAEASFKLTPEQLRRLITPKTKWLVLNSPSNPTGAVYTRKELIALGQVLLERPHVWILSDDIYEHLYYSNDQYATIAQVVPQLSDRTLTMNGVSKAYCMTGWRLGYAGGPAALIEAMCTINSQATTHACSISQAAAVAALDGPQDILDEHRNTYRERRDLVVSRLNSMPGLTCLVPDGAFYVFPACDTLIGRELPDGSKIESERDLVRYFLESEGVVVVPGSDFGLPNHFRISFAASKDMLANACDRIENAIHAIKP